MASSGFTAGVRRQGRCMGIQFIKSSETLHADSVTGTPCSSSYRDPTASAERPNNYSHSGPMSLPGFQRRDSGSGDRREIEDLHHSSASYPVQRDDEFWGRPTSGEYGTGQAFEVGGENCAAATMHSRRSVSFKNNKMPRHVGSHQPHVPAVKFSRTPEAQPILSREEYLAAWKNEKDQQVQKLRKLAYEVVSLKSNRPNAIDKLNSAANRVPIRIEFNTETVFRPKNNSSFLCHVFMEGTAIASGEGVKIKDSKINAYEAALQKILMPHLRIAQLDPERRELQGSETPFTTPPPMPSQVNLSKNEAKLPLFTQGASQKASSVKEMVSHHKESNQEAACLKRHLNDYKPLEDFVIVEPNVPIPDCTAAHTLRRSADFNHMLLEYEYFFRGEAARCILKIENQVLADVNGFSKIAAKNLAAAHALKKLKNICWVIKTKQAVDSNTKITKEDMLNELNDQSDVISHDNVGNKLLRKMGWSGGGVGKDGTGIAEPLMLKSVLNREGLGLSAKKGITDEFRNRIREVIENYASSDNQEDLVFAYDFRMDERQVIHDECRRLNLRSKCRGKGNKRYLCVRRKRSANQLFDHIMSCGGETARYILVPPGSAVTDLDPGLTRDVDMMDHRGEANKGQNFKGNGTRGSDFQTKKLFDCNGKNSVADSTRPCLLGSAPNMWDVSERQGLQNIQDPYLGNIQGSRFEPSRNVNSATGNNFAQNFSGRRSQFNANHTSVNAESMGKQWAGQQSKGNFHAQDNNFVNSGISLGMRGQGVGMQNMLNVRQGGVGDHSQQFHRQQMTNVGLNIGMQYVGGVANQWGSTAGHWGIQKNIGPTWR